MARKRKLVNHSDLPDHVIMDLARFLYPTILEYYQSEEGQQEFARWLAEQEKDSPKEKE